MKPFLLTERYDDNLQRKISNENELIEDLNLQIIFNAMAREDNFLYNTAKSVVLNSLTDIGTIIYRQNVLKDCLNNRSVINKIYDIATTTLEEAAYYRQYTQPNYAKIISPSVKVMNSVGLLEILVVKLEKLRALIRLSEKNFHSKGLITFCNKQTAFLTDEFFERVNQHITELNSISEGGNIKIGSGIGNGMKGTGHILRKITTRSSKTNSIRKSWGKHINNVINLNNISLANSAREIEDAGLFHILRLINHFNNGIIDFLESLRYEIGFYFGCINLYSVLKDLNAEVSFPVPDKINKRNLVFKGLFDLSLSISGKKMPVSNDLDAVDKKIFMITGANQGGKSTYLRSIGIAQILMQCGLFVPANFYRANVCDSIFTHFTKEEDINMNSGKLDEELQRINDIVNNITNNSLLLLNEPFATTTEREGTRIAMDIIAALYEHNVKILFVTHLFELSNFIYKQNLRMAIFLRAERNQNGSRSFCIKVGEPLETSYGEDLFNSTIGELRIDLSASSDGGDYGA